eukprot:208189-Amphidinium_carterae.3
MQRRGSVQIARQGVRGTNEASLRHRHCKEIRTKAITKLVSSLSLHVTQPILLNRICTMKESL